MKTVSQYKQDIANLMKKVTDIDVKATAENRELFESEISLKTELLDTVDDLNKQVKILERQDRTRELLEKDEPAVTVARNKVDTTQINKKEKFASLGEQLSAVMNAARPTNRTVDPRLYNAAASGLNETVGSDGGFLVQQDFTSALLLDAFKTGILADRCRRIQISGNANGMKINGVDETSRVSTRWGGMQGYWASEADEKTKSKPKFREIELNLKKLIGLCYATDELMADAVALEGVIRSGFASEFGFLIDDAIINGTGAGQPLGILNSGSLVSVSKETGQKAATLVAENIVKMYSRRFAAQTGNYAWYYNQAIEPQLFTMSLSVGLGGVPIYMPPGGLSDAPYGRLMGLPAIAIEQAAALGTAGDIILADFKDGYVLAEKGGVQSDMSIHVRFIYDESVFRFILRIDGQPVRASALTPYKGGASATQSHFITLETRA